MAVAEVVVLPARLVRLVVVGRAVERMRPAFAVTDLIDDEDQATGPGPGHAHVLQFRVLLAAVVGMGEEDPRHRLAGLGGDVERASPSLEESRSALVGDVLDVETVPP